MNILGFIVIAHGSILDYDFTSSIGQVILDTSGNDNHAVLGDTLLESASDPIITDRGAYFTPGSYISLPPNSLLPLASLSLGNFYGVLFIYIVSPGTIFTISLSQSVKLKLEHQTSTITFYQYVFLPSSASRPLSLNSWQAVHIGYNFLSIGSCISTSLTIKVVSESSSLSGLPLSTSTTYTVQLGAFSGLSGFEGFISEFHLYNANECATAYSTHASATFPSSFSSPYTSGTGDSCSCSVYSCTGSPLTCIQCDSLCDLYCSPALTCIDIVDICKPYAIVSGICDTSVLYINNCKTQQSSLICTVCDTGYYLASDQYTCCQTGYYFISSQNCQICDSSCATCDGSTAFNCISCSDSLATLNPDKSCTCDLGTDPVTGDCLGCLPDCATCNSIDTCLTCKDSNAQLNSNSLCECPGTFYDDPNTSALDCLACHSSCSTCSGPTSSNCISCVDPNASSISGTCICNTFFYYNSVSSYCENCHSNCVYCSSGLITGCTQCVNPNSELLASPGMCSCKSGFLEMNSSPLICSPCHVTCSSCFGTSDFQCTSCSDSQANLVNWLCLCNSGFYYNSNWQCIGCFVDCEECAGAGDSMCISCKDPNAILNSVPGICQCAAGYIETGQNPLVCSACHIDCITCTGLTKNDCSSCSAVNSKLIMGQCECDTGFVPTGQNPLICTACYVDCFACVGLTINDCISCKPPNSYLNNGACECTQGYLKTSSNPLICSSCHQNCLECSGLSINECIKCKSESSILIDSICKCKPGFATINFDPLICFPCFETCKTCSGTTKNDCLDCIDPHSFLNNGECKCSVGFYMNNYTNSCEECETGYYLKDSTCYRCYSSCNTCSGNSKYDCLTCKNSSIVPSNNSGICECNQGEYINNLSPLECIACSNSCKICTKLECLECIQGYSIKSSECIQNELNLDLLVLSNNTILFSFSEPLSKNLKKTEIISKVGDKPLGFSLNKKNSSTYEVILNNPKFSNKKLKITFSIRGKITSKSNSLLKKTYFFCYIEKPHVLGFTNPYVLEASIDIILKVSVFAAISSIFLRSKNGSVWISLNTIQMLSYIPLFNIKIPDILNFFLLGIRPVSILPNPFEILGKFSCTTQAIPLKFQEYGYSCKYFLLNCGEILLLFLIGLSFSLVFLVLYLITCKPFNFLRKYLQKKLNNYKYSFFLRFWIQSYTDIALITVITLDFVIIIQLSASTKYEEADSTFTLFSAIILVLTPIVFIIFYKKNMEKINQKEKLFIKKFSPLVKDFNLTGANCYFYPIFFSLRLVFVGVLYCLQNFPFWQIGVSCFIQILSLSFMAKFKVFREKWNLRLYFFEEILIFIVFFMVGLLLFDFSTQVVEIICYFVIVIVVIGVLVGFLSIICGIILDIKKRCRKIRSRDKNSVIFKINNEENAENDENNENSEIKEIPNKTPDGSFPEFDSKSIPDEKSTNLFVIRRAPSFIYTKITKN